MKHRFCPLILAGMGLASVFSATATDVYVYAPTGETLGKATEVQRIEFNKAGKLTLVPVEGDKIDFDLDKLECFAFKSITVSGSADVEAVNATVRLVGDMLSVTSASEISEIRVYNVLGELIGSCTPGACEAIMTVNARGLGIVVVAAGGIVQTYKIVR